MSRRVKVPAPLESEVLRSVKARLSRLGITLHRRNTGAMREGDRLVRFSSPGQADLYGWDRTGRHWEIEVKREGEKPTAKQLKWLRECESTGAVAFWVDDPQIAELVASTILAGHRVTWRDDGTFDMEAC